MAIPGTQYDLNKWPVYKMKLNEGYCPPTHFSTALRGGENEGRWARRTKFNITFYYRSLHGLVGLCFLEPRMRTNVTSRSQPDHVLMCDSSG